MELEYQKFREQLKRNLDAGVNFSASWFAGGDSGGASVYTSGNEPKEDLTELADFLNSTVESVFSIWKNGARYTSGHGEIFMDENESVKIIVTAEAHDFENGFVRTKEEYRLFKLRDEYGLLKFLDRAEFRWTSNRDSRGEESDYLRLDIREGDRPVITKKTEKYYNSQLNLFTEIFSRPFSDTEDMEKGGEVSIRYLGHFSEYIFIETEAAYIRSEKYTDEVFELIPAAGKTESNQQHENDTPYASYNFHSQERNTAVSAAIRDYISANGEFQVEWLTSRYRRSIRTSIEDRDFNYAFEILFAEAFELPDGGNYTQCGSGIIFLQNESLFVRYELREMEQEKFEFRDRYYSALFSTREHTDLKKLQSEATIFFDAKLSDQNEFSLSILVRPEKGKSYFHREAEDLYAPSIRHILESRLTELNQPSDMHRNGGYACTSFVLEDLTEFHVPVFLFKAPTKDHSGTDILVNESGNWQKVHWKQLYV